MCCFLWATRAFKNSCRGPHPISRCTTRKDWWTKRMPFGKSVPVKSDKQPFRVYSWKIPETGLIPRVSHCILVDGRNVQTLGPNSKGRQVLHGYQERTTKIREQLEVGSATLRDLSHRCTLGKTTWMQWKSSRTCDSKMNNQAILRSCRATELDTGHFQERHQERQWKKYTWSNSSSSSTTWWSPTEWQEHWAQFVF